MNSTADSFLPHYSVLVPLASLPPLYIGLLAAVGLPTLAIILNVLRQLLIPVDPSLPPEVFHLIPWFGSAASYGDDPLNFFFKCREKYGDVFTFVLLGRKMTVALGPKGNNFILGGRLSQVSAEEAYTNLTTPIFGKDVAYDVPNHVFMEQKRFVKVGLTIENFRAYMDMIEEEVEGYLNSNSNFQIYRKGSTEEWGSFPALQTMAEVTILTASRTLQGKEVRQGLDASVADLYADLDGAFTPINFLFPNLPLPSYRKRDRAHEKMSSFYVDVIKKRRAGEGLLDGGHDMIEALSNQTYKDGRPIPDHEIAHIMIALLMAGQHTSSTTLSWSLLHLSNKPEIERALYEEHCKVFRQKDGSFRKMEYEDLKSLPLLDAVIRETLRMHPPIHSIIRKVVGDMEVPPTLAAPSNKDARGYRIPKGHYLLSSPAIAQVDPRVWKNAQEWDPYRWADPDGVAAAEFMKYTDDKADKVDYGFGAVSKGTESQYLPFGAGRHRCIGEQFAYLQVGSIISHFIRRMELNLPRPVPAHNYHTMIVQPKDCGGIKYRRRS